MPQSSQDSPSDWTSHPRHPLKRCPRPRQRYPYGAGRRSSGGKTAQGETFAMRVTTVVHHMMPFIAVVGGALVLLMPRLLNYVVAIYLILVGVIGINSIFHFVR